jgi:exopolysaccharide biosynthesis polyprenyl glycosylphosphotransferase
MAVSEDRLRLAAAPLVATGARAAVQRLVLCSRLAGDVGALLLGLKVAQGLQQRLLAGGLAQPLGKVTVFNGLAILAWLLVFAAVGLYDPRRLRNAFDEFKLVLQAVATGTIAAVFAAVLLKVFAQRSWVLATWASCTLAVLVTRMGYRRILWTLRRSGVLVSRMLIVGAGREGRDLHRSIARTPSLGLEVVGFLDDERPCGPPAPGLPDVLGPAATVREAVLASGADAVLVAGGSVTTETAERVYRDLDGLPVELHLSTGLLGIAANRVAVQRFGDTPVLGLRRVELSGAQQALKRAFDLAGCSLALLLLSPVLVACAVAVKLSGPGPVLFRQRRVGQGGREFVIHKFRSMQAGAEQRLIDLRDRNEAAGPMFKLRDDPRVTRTGRFLRTWSLDELPQLLDVLRGDMSLVGPRPPLPDEVATYDPLVRNRLRVKPGMTGLWQVSGRHRLSFDDYVRHDLFYVENWSLVTDLFIVLRTIPAVMSRSGI